MPWEKQRPKVPAHGPPGRSPGFRTVGYSEADMLTGQEPLQTCEVLTRVTRHVAG